jgi:hypothetical protein
MLKPYEIKLAATLLDMAADEFGNHGCNDFDLFKHLPPDEAAEFAVAANEGDDVYASAYARQNPRYAVPDWQAMRYLAKRLREDV